MSNENPYQPPSTQLETISDTPDQAWAFVEPQSVPIGRGLSWIGEGFRFFRQNPWVWIAITCLYLLIIIVSSFIPFATNILQPMLAGGLMAGLYAQDNGGDIEVRHLFEGFNVQADKLAILGALLLGITIGMMIVFLIFVVAGLVMAEGLVILTLAFIESAKIQMRGNTLLQADPHFFLCQTIFQECDRITTPLDLVTHSCESVGDIQIHRPCFKMGL